MKKLLSLFLALLLCLGLSVPALAAPTDSEKSDAAWSLYRLGLFQGTDMDTQGFPVFSLKDPLTRAQSVTMLVRLLGGEAEALENPPSHPFTDVPAWASPYVGYAFQEGLTNGRSAEIFDSNTAVSASEYLTFVLRALGYDSSSDFSWDSAWTLTDSLHITDGSYPLEDGSFTRGDAAWISLQALDARKKDDDKTLQETLGATDLSARCVWQETVEGCQKDQIIFSFAPTKDSKEVYASFTVDSVTANGVSCKVEQYETAKDVTAYNKKIGWTKSPNKTFALVKLRYDQSAAEAAAKEFIPLSGGVQCPVIVFRFHCTGVLSDGTEVQELFELPCYVDGYGGMK